MSEHMIDAFVPEGRERMEWRLTLRQIRGACECPCTQRHLAAPLVRSPATGGVLVEDPDFVPGRPVPNCGNCYGLGVYDAEWLGHRRGER